MMSVNELRAAAERLTDPEDGIGEGTANDYVCGGFAADDAFALATAYLAEHPADDGEPITAEWLRSVGFVAHKPDGLPAYAVLPCVYIRLDGGELELDGIPLDFSTRGQLRRLCAALGDPLKEGN